MHPFLSCNVLVIFIDQMQNTVESLLFYPINDEANTALYAKYRKLADNEKNLVIGGRLAEYRYYDHSSGIGDSEEDTVTKYRDDKRILCYS